MSRAAVGLISNYAVQLWLSIARQFWWRFIRLSLSPVQALCWLCRLPIDPPDHPQHRSDVAIQAEQYQRTAPNATTSAVSITTSAQPKIWLPIYVSLPCAAPVALVALFCGEALVLAIIRAQWTIAAGSSHSCRLSRSVSYDAPQLSPESGSTW